jgi:hypothetical protein
VDHPLFLENLPFSNEEALKMIESKFKELEKGPIRSAKEAIMFEDASVYKYILLSSIPPLNGKQECKLLLLLENKKFLEEFSDSYRKFGFFETVRWCRHRIGNGLSDIQSFWKQPHPYVQQCFVPDFQLPPNIQQPFISSSPRFLEFKPFPMYVVKRSPGEVYGRIPKSVREKLEIEAIKESVRYFQSKIDGNAAISEEEKKKMVEELKKMKKNPNRIAKSLNGESPKDVVSRLSGFEATRHPPSSPPTPPIRTPTSSQTGRKLS